MSDDETADGFVKCPKGHIYEAELKKCPYCGGLRLEEDLLKLIDKNPDIIKKFKDLASCYITGPKDF